MWCSQNLCEYHTTQCDKKKYSAKNTGWLDNQKSVLITTKTWATHDCLYCKIKGTQLGVRQQSAMVAPNWSSARTVGRVTQTRKWQSFWQHLNYSTSSYELPQRKFSAAEVLCSLSKGGSVTLHVILQCSYIQLDDMLTVERIWICVWKIIYNFQYRLTCIVTEYIPQQFFLNVLSLHVSWQLAASINRNLSLPTKSFSTSVLFPAFLPHTSSSTSVSSLPQIFISLYPSPWTRRSCLSTRNPASKNTCILLQYWCSV